MTRTICWIAVVGVVVLAGCMGGPGGAPTATEQTGDGLTNASSAAVPGVADGTLSNATALATAHSDALTSDGGNVSVTEDAETTSGSFQYSLSSDVETYSLTGTHQRTDGPTVDVSLWSNESVRIARQSADGEDHYRVVDRRRERPSGLDGLSEYLAAGDFTVANESTGNGTVVLTADESASTADSHGRFADAETFSGRLVVEESGLVRNLTVEASVDGEVRSIRYAVTETGVDSVAAPAWVENLPPGATVQAHLDVDVENGSILVIRHDGGDAVPRESVVSVTTNETSGEATFDEPLEAGDRQFLYVDADTGAATLATDRPPAEAVDSIEPPVSLTVRTDAGATLLNAGMSWGSDTASEPESGSASSSSASASGSSAEASRTDSTR